MHPLHYRSGFALITSLIVLVVLTVLGTGAFFLTSMNLRIAENGRSGSIALYNAHRGLDLALLAIGQEYSSRGDFGWPSVGELRARIPDNEDFRIVSLDLDAPDADTGIRAGGNVTVLGLGPNGARYETGARFEGQLSEFSRDAEHDPIFGVGWVTDADIDIRGKTTFSIPLWAGGDIDGSGSVEVLPIAKFVWAVGECLLKLKDEVRCKGKADPPVVPLFSFDAELLQLQEQRPTCDITINSNGSLVATSYRNQTVCLGEGVTLTVTGTAEGLYILGPATSTVVFNAVAAGTSEDIGVKIAAGTFTSSSSFALNGMNTIFTKNNINFISGNSQTRGVRSGTEHYINTLFGTEGNVNIDKASGTLDAIIWANGHFCKYGNGGLNFTGSILTKGLGATSGSPCKPGIYWNGGGGGTFTAVGNDDIPTIEDDESVDFRAAGIMVVAKRP